MGGRASSSVLLGEGLGEVKDIADRGKGFPEDMGFVVFF